MSGTAKPPFVRATVTVELDEPVLINDAYKLLHQYAALNDLDQTDNVDVQLKVSFMGRPHPLQLAAFREMVRNFTVAHVEVLEVLE